MNDTPLPSIYEMHHHVPLSPQHAHFVMQSRDQGKAIVQGKDLRKVIIVGPCSIHDKKSAMEYAQRLKKLAEEVSDTLFLVMRVYVEKSRSLTGWKGWIYDPYLDGSYDIQTGILWTRELLVSLTEMQVPIATEFVDPLATYYFQDLITWGFIGARTSASQPHRQLASALPFPIGFKNSTDGNVDQAVQGVFSAKASHCFIHIDEGGHVCAKRSKGNSWSHIVLRGAHHMPNYDIASIHNALHKLANNHLPQRLMVDCSHGNCQKKHERQKIVFHSLIEQIQEGNDAIFGMMLESHLQGGNQPLTEDPTLLRYATSITDPCIDWETTQDLIYSAHVALSSSPSSSYAGSSGS